MLKLASLLLVISFILLPFIACKKSSCDSCITYGWTLDISGKNYRGSSMISAVNPDSISFLIDGPLDNSNDSVVFGLDLFLACKN